MKLLFLTQVLDREDAILGFVSRWVRGLASEVESLRVIALEVGDTSDLPANVSAREVGRKGRICRYLRYRKLLHKAFAEDGFDTVLAHMVPRYSLLAHGPAQRAGAREFLWYTHAGVDRRLERAVSLVERVFTASEDSLRVSSPKKLVTGHGIDLEHFGRSEVTPPEPARLVSVGRLTPRKDPLTILAALALLLERGFDVYLDLVGGGLTVSDEGFKRQVEARIVELGLAARVRVLGAVPYLEIPAHFETATVVVNASLTGSLDKVTLEAMASRRPVVSCNDTSPALFAELGAAGEALCFKPGDSAGLATCLAALLSSSAARRGELGAELRALVARDHEVGVLMARLVDEMGGAS